MAALTGSLCSTGMVELMGGLEWLSREVPDDSIVRGNWPDGNHLSAKFCKHMHVGDCNNSENADSPLRGKHGIDFKIATCAISPCDFALTLKTFQIGCCHIDACNRVGMIFCSAGIIISQIWVDCDDEHLMHADTKSVGECLVVRRAHA